MRIVQNCDSAQRDEPVTSGVRLPVWYVYAVDEGENGSVFMWSARHLQVERQRVVDALGTLALQRLSFQTADLRHRQS